MGQMRFTKYIVVVDDNVDVHNTSDARFRLCANTDPQRDSLFIPQSRDPSDVLDRATSPAPAGPAAANSASTRRRRFPANVSNAPGRRSSKLMPR